MAITTHSGDPASANGNGRHSRELGVCQGLGDQYQPDRDAGNGVRPVLPSRGSGPCQEGEEPDDQFT